MDWQVGPLAGPYGVSQGALAPRRVLSFEGGDAPSPLGDILSRG